jgi:selenocysteine-specific elongation factor
VRGLLSGAAEHTLNHLVVGTAGHVDHGKTRLVAALTGIDCDRLAEEKARGITIDLGFAHRVEGDVTLGFVDVPGHERFVHNALAGLGGIRALLLVVAADEGVKPQTREHVAIGRLLGIPRAVVALTKCDLVSPDLLELARLEVSELLADTPWREAPMVAVSSVTGEGIPSLLAELLAVARALPAPAAATRPARLPIDRAFHLRGLGVVVTGTLAAGRVAVGDTLAVLPGEPGAGEKARLIRLRGIEVHGQPRESAVAGERVALQLAGVELADVARGRELVAPGAYRATRLLAAEIELLAEAPPLGGFVPVRVHLFAGEALGRMRPLEPRTLAPGARGLVEIRLAQPLVAARGDRLVLRRPSPTATIGGGEVRDPFWPRRRGKALAGLVGPLAAGPPALYVAWVLDAGEAGSSEPELAARMGLPVREVSRALEPALAAGELLAVGSPGERRLVAPRAYRRVRDRAKRLLSEYFGRERLAPGMPRAELLARLFPLAGRAATLGDTYLGWMAAERLIVAGGDLVNLPGRKVGLSGEESKLETALLARYEAAGLEAPGPVAVANELGAKPQIVDGVLRYLVERGRLVRLSSGLLVATAAVERLRAELLLTGWERFSVPQFKDRFGLSRKWAIPLLEHLDGLGVTRRVGEERVILRRRPAG